MAAAGQAVLGDQAGQFAAHLPDRRRVGFPETLFGGDHEDGQHVRLDVGVVALAEELRQAKPLRIVEVNGLHFIPRPVLDQIGARHLPAPQVFEEFLAHRPCPGVAVTHQRLEPGGIEEAAAQFAEQGAGQRFDIGPARLGVLQDQRFRRLAGTAFDGQRQAAEIIEGVVIVEQAVKVAGPPVVGAFDAVERRIEGGVGGLAGLVEAVGVAHAVAVGAADFVALAPGAGTLGQAIDARAVSAGGIAENALGGGAAGFLRRQAGLFKGGQTGQPFAGNAVVGGRFVAPWRGRHWRQGGGQRFLQFRPLLGQAGGRGGERQAASAVDQVVEIGIEVAEQAGGGDDDIAANDAGLEADVGDDATGVPHRLGAHQGEREGDHDAFVADGVGGPQDDAFRTLPGLVASQRLLRQITAQPVAEVGGQDVAIDRVEVAPGG